MTLRANGSYIGPRDSAVSVDAASGVWDLRTAQRYQEAGTWPSVFAPDNLSGLQLWLDASDSSTLYDATTGGSLVAADGGVARWEDKSGNGNHATQGTAGARPLRKASVQNSLDALRFDGSDDVLSVPSSTATFKFLHSTQATVFVVSKVGTTSDPNDFYALIGTGDGSSAQSGVLFYYDDRVAIPFNDRLRYISTTGAGLAIVSGADNNFTPNVFSLASAVIDNAAGTAADRLTLHVNSGSPENNNTNTGTPSTSNSVADLTIGATANSLIGNLDGDICEIIIYNTALSDTDREAVENYLIEKWGIT